jgi:hypothetical protein
MNRASRWGEDNFIFREKGDLSNRCDSHHSCLEDFGEFTWPA